MTAIKFLFIVFCFLLTSCAPKPPLEATTLAAPTDAELAAMNKPSTEATEIAVAETDSGQPEKKLNGQKTKDVKEVSSTDKGKDKIDKSGKTSPATPKADAKTENKALKIGSAATAISSWEISGAMAARSKNKGWSASLNWIQRGANQYQMRLFGPLGSGTVIISRQGGVVSLRDGPKSATSRSAEELLMRETGVRLPVANLYYWVRGLPAPGAIQGAKRDSANRLLVLRQGGYTIEYNQYTSAGKAVLPSHIRLQGNGIFIKLVIKRWRV